MWSLCTITSASVIVCTIFFQIIFGIMMKVVCKQGGAKEWLCWHGEVWQMCIPWLWTKGNTSLCWVASTWRENAFQISTYSWASKWEWNTFTNMKWVFAWQCNSKHGWWHSFSTCGYLIMWNVSKMRVETYLPPSITFWFLMSTTYMWQSMLSVKLAGWNWI